MSDIQTLRYLLAQTATIKKQHDKIAAITGINFNIFQLLKISTHEVRLHSTFIAELLNPSGAHGQGDVFLNIFIATLHSTLPLEKIDFIAQDASISIESYAGRINDDCTEGGRIDIVISDKKKKRIILENKIHAADHQNQLIRYKNFDKGALLLYLTLDGKDASEWSKGGMLESNIDYFPISYRVTIRSWLEQCQKEVYNLPFLRETLGQYIHLINHLTNQSNSHIMTEEIKSILLQNVDYFKSVDLLVESRDQLIAEIKHKFWEEINHRRPKDFIASWEDCDIIYEVCEDSTCFYYGFYLSRNGKTVSPQDTEATSLVNALKSINSNFVDNKIFLGWIGSQYVFQFKQLDKETLCNLSTPEFRNKFVSNILLELEEYINQFKQRIKKLTT